MLLALALFFNAPAVSAPGSQPASAPIISKETRPELFRDEPPARVEDSKSDRDTNDSPTWFWVKMLVRTVLVLGAVVLLAYLVLNRGMAKLMKLTGNNPTKSVTIIERTPLGQKNSLYVIEVQGRRFLVGSGEQSVSLLAELSDSAPVRVMTKEPS